MRQFNPNYKCDRREAYIDYINSDHWDRLRSIKKTQVGYRCECCRSQERLQVHHINYRDLTDCTTEDLIALCYRCHTGFHSAIKRNGTKSCHYSREETISLIKNFYQVTPSGVDAKAIIESAYKLCVQECFSKKSLENLQSKIRSLLSESNNPGSYGLSRRKRHKQWKVIHGID